MPVDLKYGHVTLQHQGSVGADEPVVVFRAQDQFLPDVLRAYATMCHDKRSPQRHLDLIRRSIERVLEWQRDNFTKVPTSDSLDGR